MRLKEMFISKLAIGVPWLHLKAQTQAQFTKPYAVLFLSWEQISVQMVIMQYVFQYEQSVICKLFHIRSALLISDCRTENSVPSGSFCCGGELLLFHQLMDISSFFSHFQMYYQLPWER